MKGKEGGKVRMTRGDGWEQKMVRPTFFFFSLSQLNCEVNRKQRSTFFRSGWFGAFFFFFVLAPRRVEAAPGEAR